MALLLIMSSSTPPSLATTGVPLENLNPLSLFQRFPALNPIRNTKAGMVFLETHPRVLAVLNRTAAKADSTGLVVLM